MCIEITIPINPTSIEQIAWKVIKPVFRNGEDRWEPLYKWGVFARGKWVKAKNSKYGFNVFINRRAAEYYVYWHGGTTVKVKIRKIHGKGRLNRHIVLFAKEIYVPEIGEKI